MVLIGYDVIYTSSLLCLGVITTITYSQWDLSNINIFIVWPNFSDYFTPADNLASSKCDRLKLPPVLKMFDTVSHCSIPSHCLSYKRNSDNCELTIFITCMNT